MVSDFKMQRAGHFLTAPLILCADDTYLNASYSSFRISAFLIIFEEVKIKAEHAEDGGVPSPNSLEPITAETADKLDGKEPEVVMTSCKGQGRDSAGKS